ncbi:Sodium/pantothenate symporter [bacterium HR36]|nr:Sodium/pantothenate symporter [bacterium HR36]
MGIELGPDSSQVLLAFAVYLVGVAGLGIFSHRYLRRGEFLQEYFLGNRELGAWVLALSVAATAISGGTFMGFPALIYSHGWVLGLWIASYMVVPLTTMLLMGRRINQVGRIAGAVTVPDILRDRFDCPALGILASAIILVFLPFNLVAQFKAGGLVMREAMQLRPDPAQLLRQQVNDENQLVLHWRLSNGLETSYRVPPLSRSGHWVLEQTLLDHEARRLEVVWQDALVQYRQSVEYPMPRWRVPGFTEGLDAGYLLGLIIFAGTVIGYTAYGGFWAVTWTDVLEGLVMLVGALVMAVLAVRAVPVVVTETDTYTGLAAASWRLHTLDPQLAHAPGPGQFLPWTLAVSFFLMWSLMGPAQPSTMVRLMSFRDTLSMRRALFLISIYFSLIYLALLVIFTCARAIFPTEYMNRVGSRGLPDSIMPAMIRHLTGRHPWLGGLLLAAPYAAIMSTVAAYLLTISSSLVRDLVERSLGREISRGALRTLSYGTTALIGVIVFVGALNPPEFLQYIIVFTGSGLGCSFLVPMLMTLYWRRATKVGVLLAVLGGFLGVFVWYLLGWVEGHSLSALERYAQAVHEAHNYGQPIPPAPHWAQWVQKHLAWLPGWGRPRVDRFTPLYPFGFDPLVCGLLCSVIGGLFGSWWTRPDPQLVAKYFPE